MNDRAAELIRHLGLQPHPEGGHYAEVHRSTAAVDPLDGRPRRAALTSIYFLLQGGAFSRWHRVASDEVWCHLEGAPLLLHELDEATHTASVSVLGPVGSEAGAALPQATVPAGRWQAAECAHPDGYVLVACMVAPGFDFADFRMLSLAEPLAAWLREQAPALARFV